MGNSQNPVPTLSRLANSDNTTLHGDAAPFHPKAVRSDTTLAQAGSPPRSLLDDENPDTSSSANSSFPLSESALPTTFDTSGDLAPAQLSHYFPLPPTKIDTHASQKSFAASNSPSSASQHKISMSSVKGPREQTSLQETLDALWAPPKHVPVRISAQATPIARHDELLIDFSCDSMPTMSSFPAMPSSSNTSMELKTPNQSVDAPRTETLTQLLANHPQLKLNLAPLQSSPKYDPTDLRRQNGGPISILLAGDDEPIQLPPYTYADAANIAFKYPELAEKVLKEPLATPKNLNAVLEPEPEPEPEPEEEPEPYFEPPQEVVEPEPVVPPAPVTPVHTFDSPNWAVAPDDPEPDYRDYRPRRDRNDFPRERPDYVSDRPDYGRDRSDYGRHASGGRPRPSDSGRRGSSGFAQNQNEFDATWQYGGNGGGGGGRPSANDSPRYPTQSRGYDENEDYHNARNGPTRRGWSQDQSSGNDGPSFGNEGRHDVPPHLRGRGGDDSRDQSLRLPTRPSAARVDSLNASARVDEPAAGGGDPFTPSHDPWTAASTNNDAWAAPSTSNNASAAPAEPKPVEAVRQESQAEAVDPWTPSHDPWTAPVTQPAAAPHTQPAPAPAPPSQSFRSEGEGRDSFQKEAAAPAADEWMASNDPWASGGNQNQNQGQQSKHLEPENKREPPSSIRGGGSPFRDRMNDSTYQPDRSVNEVPFSANVLDVRAPSQASVAALAASRVSDMYDRPPPDKPASASHVPAPNELPVEFNYFLHSETVDWTSPGPTRPGQNSFSPSQNLVTPARELTPVRQQTPVREREKTPVREREREITAPAPRSADHFDYNQQPADNSTSAGGFGGYATKENRADAPPAENYNNSFVLGTMKTDSHESYRDPSYRRDGPASQWGHPEGERDRGRDFQDIGRGRPSGASPGRGGSPGYGRRGGDEPVRRADDQYGPGGGDARRGGDDHGPRGGDDPVRRADDQYGPGGNDGRRGGDDYGRGGDDRRGDDYGRRGGDDYGRGGDDYGRRGGDDHGQRGRDDYGRGGDDRRGDDYGRRGGDDYGRRGGDDRRGDDHGRRGGDDYGRRGDDYGRRGGDDYGRRGDDYGRRGGDDRGRGDRRDDNGPRPGLNKYGGAGPLPTPYSGPPRVTSFGAKDFVLPPAY
ncbi:hypothetical protein DFH06DRAFT_297603 [Mycena polygramma]|nr:hypothetical protein DFH06DRAFT_297603 [Mycena polygramma]